MLETEPDRAEWPAWYGLAALLIALLVSVVAGGLLFAIIAAATGIKSDAPGVNIGLTLVLDAALLGSAVFLASKVKRPTFAQFGLRRVRFWRAVKWMAIACAIYFPLAIAYTQVVHPDEQTTLSDLGAGSSTVMTILIGVLVVGVAPVVEETFFRGFLYGSLRTRLSFLPAALADGVVFGIVHASTGPQAIPPLIVLGFSFCLMYEATGSILPGMVLHSLNNMLAFGADKDGSWAVAGATAVVVVTAVVTLPRTSRTLS